MRYYNRENAEVAGFEPEYIPPFTVTRDYTEAEKEKSPSLRNSISQEYLVPFDPKLHASALNATKPKPVQAKWVTAPDSIGGKLVKKTLKSGYTVEYISAEEEGVDGVNNATPETDLIAAVPGAKPIDHIEKGFIAPNPGDVVEKPVWRDASEAFEKEINDETTQDIEMDDAENLSEQEPERDEIPDADEEIAKDFSQMVISRPGKQGAIVTDAKTEIEAASAKATHAINKATAKDADDGEKIAAGGNVSPRTAEFLDQSFSQKKWAVSKETDSSFLQEVKGVTRSENLREIVTQRLQELGG